MSKPGIKDPTVPRSTRAARLLFHRPVAGLAGSVLMARFAGGHAGKALASTMGADGPVGQAVAVAGASAVGYGLGYGTMVALQRLRRELIAYLLTYKSWIFEQSSTKTKLWAVLLKFLIGPGPHRLFEFEDVLPRLPLPTLQQTCSKYLDTVRPLLTDEEYANTEDLVKSFEVNQGPVLQKYLMERRKKLRSWLADWWLTTAYLARRESIAVNVNFYMMSTVKPEISVNNVARCSSSLHVITRYYEMIQDRSLPPDMIMDMIPVCMESVAYMLGSCRIPGDSVDSLTFTATSRHVIIISKGVYFRLDMYALDEDGKSRILSKAEIKPQVLWILEQTKDVADVNAVASLTSDNRQEWAKNRRLLMKNPVNAETIREIETAIFIAVLSDRTPRDENEQALLGLTGDGASRWFDKGLTIEFFDKTTMAVGNMEHSGADATHFNIMWEHCLQMEEFGPDGDIKVIPGEKLRNLDPPKRLSWEFNNEMQSAIDRALQQYNDMKSDVDLVIYHTKYGKRWMKKQNVSPDGFLQMAVQLAYWRLHREITKTYEPASHRLFALGRTDNINPVSDHSVTWLKTMDDSNATDDVRIRRLLDAIAHQSRVRLEATAGYGSDRHLLGLVCSARELGMDMPPIFLDKAYNLPMKLSTSQVPTNVGYYSDHLILDSCVGGFGPVCHEGYGLLYCNMANDMFNFNITSWKSCEKTDSTMLAKAIDGALEDLKMLLEKQHISNGAVNKRKG